MALDGGFALLFLLVVVVATKLDRFQYKRDGHYDNRDNLEVSHDLTPLQPSYPEVKSQAPSVSFLPEARRLHLYFIITARIRQIMFYNRNGFPSPFFAAAHPRKIPETQNFMSLCKRLSED